jgi:predicted MFS family arabinose efflux permease
MTTRLSRGGLAALLAGHCAGMMDLVALPVWVGALISWYKLDPQQAGLLASLFLGGQVVSSLVLAPRFGRFPARVAAIGGFSLASLSFLGVSSTGSYPIMALLHFTGGLGAGCALSVTHGLIGRTANPHRLFAIAGFALAVLGIFMLGGGSKLLAAQGGGALFVLFAGVMFVAMVAAMLAFPRLAASAGPDSGAQPPLPPQVWFGMLGMGLLALAQAAAFSFVERIGADRGYGTAAVTGVLVAAGIFNLVPGPLAGWLQSKLRAEAVVLVGPLAHAAIVFTLTQTPAFQVYAGLVPVLIAVVVFTHTFLFGLLARLDASGRAVAATPAMLMIGAAIGPALGGTAVKFAGYPALGVVVAGVGLLSALSFLGAGTRRPLPAAPVQPA